MAQEMAPLDASWTRVDAFEAPSTGKWVVEEDSSSLIVLDLGEAERGTKTAMDLAPGTDVSLTVCVLSLIHI